MTVFEHTARQRIFNPGQHPYKHTLDDFAFVHDSLPGVTTLSSALNWIFTVLYPNTQDPVATPAALPLVGNTIGHHRVVTDDGDGKAAGYQWQQREGDASAKWYKVSDMDWGVATILSQFLLKTQDVYAYRYGYDDLDDTGAPLTGSASGQHLFGGASAGTHLTFHANAGDGVGAQTGYIQLADHLRPTADSMWTLGTTAERWLKVWTDELTVSTLTLLGGSITDSSGAISFADENLATTGTLATGTHTIGNMVMASGTITNTSGAISFDNENLSTTGTLASGVHTVGTLVLAGGVITDTTGTLSFDNENLITTGTLSAGVITGTQLNVDNLRLDGNTFSSTSGGIALLAASGVVDVQTAMTTIAQTVTGILAVTGQLNVDNLRFDGNTVSSTDGNGNVILDPNGSGLIELGSAFFPATDSSWDIGKTGNVWNKLWLDGSIGDGSTEITSSVLQSLRDINSGVNNGYSLFWNGTKWVSSLPDTEVDHGTITGLGDDDHTQYALLLGRAGGQTVYGGTASGDDLLLRSTSNGTKGHVGVEGDLLAFTDATYHLGGSSNRFVDLYLSGQMIGARVENYSTAGRPAASAGTKGRLYYDTTVDDVYVDRGGTWKKMSIEKYVIQDASGWDGVVTSVAYTVSSEVSDARECIWAFKNNANAYEQLAVEITMTQTQVTVTGNGIAAGTYTLVGIG